MIASRCLVYTSRHVIEWALDKQKRPTLDGAGRFSFHSVAAEVYQPNRDREIGLRRGKLRSDANVVVSFRHQHTEGGLGGCFMPGDWPNVARGG